MTIQEAATILGVAVRTVQKRVKLGQMRAERMGARGWVIPVEEVIRWREIGKMRPGRKRDAGQTP